MNEHVNGTPMTFSVACARWPDPGVNLQRGNDQPLGAIVVNGNPVGFFLQYGQALNFVSGPMAIKHLANIVDLFVRAPQVDPSDRQAVLEQAKAMGESIAAAKAFIDKHREAIAQAVEATRTKIIDPKADAQGQNLLRLGKILKPS